MTELEYQALIKHLTFMRDIYFQRPELAGISIWAGQQIQMLKKPSAVLPFGGIDIAIL